MASRKRKRPDRRTTRSLVSHDIAREAAYIIGRAKECDSRVVTLGQLIYFSAESGDAWMLDPEDHLALCLAEAGDALPIHLAETATSFEVGWTSSYQLENDTFVVVDGSRVRAIFGYPVRDLARAEQIMLATHKPY